MGKPKTKPATKSAGNVRMSLRERDGLLAAVRLWQEHLRADTLEDQPDATLLLDIAECHGEQLSEKELDGLADKLQDAFGD